jgi:predicted TIM-barrel fold metal-dependent hydrolase
MQVPPGAIDCDIHPAVPSTTALLPYLPEYWHDQFLNRHIERSPFTLMSYPPNAPASCRPDWRVENGLPGSDVAALRRQALDAFGTSIAICNVLHGAVALFNADMAAVLCAAINDWTARELLDRDPRLRASILLPMQNPELAVREIERLAGDHRFVQVLSLVMGDALAGDRRYWPVYQAAERHGLPVALHISDRADLFGVAVLSSRGLHRQLNGVRERADQLHRGRRISAIPQAQAHLQRGRVYVAANPALARQ